MRIKRLSCYFGNTLIFYFLALWLKTYVLNKILGIKFSDTDAFFSLVFVKNDGAAFNIFSGFQDMLIIFAALIILLITIFLARNKLYIPEKFLMMLSLFSAGIVGNAVERYTLGYVEDFIKINLFNFPVFNLNDIMITIGCVLYIAFVLFQKDSKIEENENKN